MTKDNWIKAFKDKFEKVVERFDDGSYITEGVNPEMIDFISQVEKDAINRLNHDHEILVNTILETKNKEIEDAIEKTKRETQKEIFDALDKLDMPKPLMALVKDSIGIIGPELKGLSPLLDDKSESYTNGFRDGFDAGVEKTNKRWESELYRIANEWDDELSELQGLPPHQHNPKMWSIVTKILSRMKSDLLEDKK